MSGFQLISNYLGYTGIVMGITMFIACTFQTAVYGRYSTSQGWGPLLPAKWAWIIMESPNLWVTLLVFSYYCMYNPSSSASSSSLSSSNLNTALTLESTSMTSIFNLPLVNTILISCFILHYIHRDLVFPLFIEKCQPNDMPLSVMLLAFIFCIFNGSSQAISLILVQSYSIGWLYHPQFIVGILLFILGAFINITSDYYLLSLRLRSVHHTASTTTTAETIRSNNTKDNYNITTQKQNRDLNSSPKVITTNTKVYYIPYGSFFEYVSCANYFGEIIEWLGYALACNTINGYAFVLCTMGNLIPRALKHHEWYKKKFDNYPPHRKAVIPFIC